MSDLTVFAKNKTQMLEAQNRLIDWATGKLNEELANLVDVTNNLELARKENWNLSGWRRQKLIAQKKVDFYQKIVAALEAGYVIVPDFPIDVFAVRTKRDYPVERYATSSSYWTDNVDRTQRSEVLPLGEGRYVDSVPVVKRQKQITDGNKEVYRRWAAEHRDIDFPIKLVKPAILEETSKALALKIFDEIGCNPGRQGWNPAGSRRGGDPMVVGRIVYRRPGDSLSDARGNLKTISFLIAWWLDTRDLIV